MNPPPKLTYKERISIKTSFGYSSQYQSIKNNTKINLTHILKRWNGNKSNGNPRAHAMTPAEVVTLKVYAIGIKYH